jgi:hypothetical protein
MRGIIWLATAAAIAAFTISCSSGPEPPKPGSPAFLWSAARENFIKGDNMKTNDQLQKLLASQNEFADRARPWRLVILSGLADGYIELADMFEQGARETKANPTPFRRVVTEHRSQAARYATDFAEAFAAYRKTGIEAEVAIAFPMPGGSAGPIGIVTKIGSGVMPAQGELASGQAEVLRRAVLFSVSRALGAPKDIAKASELLKGPDGARVGKDVFLKAMAQALADQAALFGKQKLQRPEHQKHFLNLALETLGSVGESKESNELKKKLQAALKGV